MNRRELFRLAAAASLAPAVGLVGCDDGATDPPREPADGGLDGGGADAEVEDTLPRDDHTGPLGPPDLFRHGVASGDPLADRVILWTRVTQGGAGPVRVFYEVASDEGFARRVAAGFTEATATSDFTVKIDVEGLAAGTVYHYRFAALGRPSPTGRTKTAPAGATDQVRFAVCSCAALGGGRLHAYEGIARADVDAILHLGDYMYEYGNRGPTGAPQEGVYDPPHETITLEDYRRRYAWYRLIPELQRAHAAHPMVCVWDDHEHANDAWRDGAQNHDPATEGDWTARKTASARAWHEWLPVRPQPDGLRIFRRFTYGDLVDVFMLDTRLYDRDQGGRQPDPERSMLGPAQEAWLFDGLRTSTATWKLLGQQVMMAPLLINGLAINLDQWDGFAESRASLLDLVESQRLTGVVVATGDIHTSWANDVPRDPLDPARYDPATGRGSVLVEFVTTAISSRSLPFINDRVARALEANNPHIRWYELTRKGYVVLDFTAERVRGDWWLYDDIDPETYTAPRHAASFGCAPDRLHLAPIDEPARP